MAGRVGGLLVLGLASLSACLAPPAVVEVAPIDGAAALARLPAGAERVAVEVAPGEHLRGFFVPVEPGVADAPVVLHLLEAGASIAHAWSDREDAVRELAGMGFASLALDWSGVGESEGGRSVDHLERDALAMWDAAVRRAGGAERVLVRATSLGTLATASLLARGCRPGAMILIAPVLASTAVRRFAVEVHGPVVGPLAAAWFREPPCPDLVAVLGATRVPLLLVSSSEDFFLCASELARLTAAATAAGGVVRDELLGHVFTALYAHASLPVEQEFLDALGLGEPPADLRLERVLAELAPAERRRFDAPAARERLRRTCGWVRADQARLVAAASLAHAHPRAAARTVAALAELLPDGLELDELADALSLADPAGALPIDWIERLERPSRLMRAYRVGRIRFGPAYAAAMAAEMADRTTEAGETDTVMRWSMSLAGLRDQVRVDLLELWRRLEAESPRREDAERRFARTLLKGLGHTERLHAGGVEVFWKGAWAPLDSISDGAVSLHSE